MPTIVFVLHMTVMFKIDIFSTLNNSISFKRKRSYFDLSNDGRRAVSVFRTRLKY